MEVGMLGEAGLVGAPEAGSGDNILVVGYEDTEMPKLGASVKEAMAAGLPRVMIKDGKRMLLVREERILWLRSRPPRPSPSSLSRLTADVIRRQGLDGEGVADLLGGFRVLQVFWDIQKDIVEQYNTTGHAYIEIDEDADIDEYEV